MLEELQVEVTNSSNLQFLDTDRTRTPAWLIRLACAVHASAASLAKRRDPSEFLVDGMGYLTALARTDLSGHLDYSERHIVEKLFQTYTMRIT